MIESSENLDNEISATTPIEVSESGLNKYPLLDLNDADFEKLIYSLFKVSAPAGSQKDWNQTALMVRGADAGRDILLTDAGRPRAVVQCKRFESAFTLPALFREISKLILFAKVNGDLKFDRELTYYLAVARDPAATVVDFVARQADLEAGKTEDLKAAAREMRERYKTLEGLTIEDAENEVLAAFPFLRLELCRPTDIASWLEREKQVAGIFFKQRVVVDNSALEIGLASILAQMSNMNAKIDGISALTDEDLKIIQDQIANVPPTHRLNLGIATFFGYPPEMFANNEDLKERLERISKLRQTVDEDYIAWVFKQAAAMAGEICQRPDLQRQTPVFARQIPSLFLSLVGKQCTETAIGSELMTGLIHKLTNTAAFRDDDARLDHVCQTLIETGERYLIGDFSQIKGDENLVTFKKDVIACMMADIENREALIAAVRQGKSVFGPELKKAATLLRERCCHKTSIVITGNSGLDNENSIKRLAEAVSMLEKLKKSG